MKLSELGFSEWFVRRLDELGETQYSVARVTSVSKGSFLLRNENGEILSELSGDFIHNNKSKPYYPTVGDWVIARYHNANTFAIIHDVLPRKTSLRRKAVDKNTEYQMIASNVDTAFIVQSCDYNFNLQRLKRYLVMVNSGHINPIILLSKSDLIDEGELDVKISAIRNMGVSCEIIPYSTKNNSGICQISEVLEKGRTYCLLGSSGVGKTTLLNHFVGEDAFATNQVRVKDGKGKHTTSKRQMVVIENGAMIIDTPGMRELGNIDVKLDANGGFEDIVGLANQCRFRNCTHINEAGCAVLEALKNGKLSKEQYESYLKLNKESEYYQMSYLEKRKKDRNFGQFLKIAKKQCRKKDE